MDIVPGTANNDVIIATNATLTTADNINGGSGTDTLLYIDTSATGAAPAAGVTYASVENINIRNISGTVTTPAVAEVTQVGVGDLALGQTMVINGQTFTSGVEVTQTTFAGLLASKTAIINGVTVTAGAGGASAEDVAKAFATGITQGTGTTTATVTGTRTAAQTATVSNNVVTFTAAAAGAQTDFADSGDGKSATITVLTQGSNDNATAADVAQALASGASVGSVSVVGARTAAQNASLSGNVVTFTATTAGTQTDFANSGTGANTSITVLTPGAAAVVSSNALEISASQFAGAQALNSEASTGAVTFTALAAGQTLGKVGGSANLGGIYASSATTAAVAISGGSTAGTITLAGDGLTTANISSSGAANTTGAISSAVASLKNWNITANSDLTAEISTAGTSGTLTITGAGKVKVGTLDSDFTTINATGMTAALTATMSSEVKAKLTAGSGNDVISTGSVLTTGSVDAGAGTDTLVIQAGGNDVATAALGAKYTNFETLRLNDSQNVSLVSGITAVELNAMNAKTVSGLSAAQAGAITVLGNQTTGLTLTLADATGSTDSVSLALKSSTATSNVSVNDLSVIGVETLNISATTGTAATADVIALAANGATTLANVNISGTADVSFSGTNSAKAITLNSTTSGIATITGNFVDGSSITTGGGKDAITLGTGFGTYNSGAGDDTFKGTTAQLNTTTSYNAINGGDGSDTLNITNGAASAVTLVDNNLAKITGIEKITIDSTTTSAQSITTGGFFDTNFKTGGVDLTTASTTGAIAVDMNTFSGAAKVTATSTTGNVAITTGTTGGVATVTTSTTTGKAEVTTGSADDVVSVTSSGISAANVISTGAGNDTIKVTTLANSTSSITGGKGADKITLGAGTDTVVIGNTDSGITVATADSITGFASAGADVLKMGNAGAAFTGSAGNLLEGTAAVADFAAALTAANVQLAAIKASTSATSEYYSFQWDATNGYLFDDTNADGVADQVVVLVGVTGTQFADTWIIA